MKVRRTNAETKDIIYIRGETPEERGVLNSMFKDGVVAFAGGSELGIVNKRSWNTQAKLLAKTMVCPHEDCDYSCRGPVNMLEHMKTHLEEAS